MKLGGKISTSSRYVIDITETDPLSLGEFGGELILKIRKNEVFLTYEGVIES